MADSANVGYASLQVIPTVKGIGGNLTKDLGLPFQKAGLAAGKTAGEGIAKGVEASASRVQSASAKVAKTREAEIQASAKVAIAEAKLQELRDKGITSGSRYMAAEENLRKAKVNGQNASRTAAQATEELATAEKDAEKSAGDLGDTLDDTGKRSLISGDNLKKFGLAAAAGVAAAGAGLFKLGQSFTEMNNTIRIGTGATGKNLEGLEQVALNVGKSVPASFDDIGTTVADLNTRLGLTGPTLEKLSSQFLEAGKMFGESIDVNTVTQAFSAFGVKGDETTKSMDQLFQISQATGVSMNELAAAAVKGAPALKSFGFTMGDSAALVGQLDKAGIDSATTLAAMQRGLVGLAKDGKTGKEALTGVVNEIGSMVKAGDEAGAINAAGKVFGTRGAVQFVNAVKSGTLSVEDFTKATGATGDTILGVADETRTFSDQWELFKNNAMVKLEPIATRVFGIITNGMGWLVDNGIPGLMSAAHWIDQNKVVLGIVAGIITATLLPALITSTAAWIKNGWEATVAASKSLAASYRTVGGWILMGTTATKQAIVSSAAWIASGARSAGAWVALKAQAVGSFIATAAGATANAAVTAGAWVASGARSAGAWAAMKVAAVGSFIATGASAVVQSAITAGAWVASQGRMALSIGIATAAFIAQKVATVAGTVATGALTVAQWALNAAMSANPIGLVIAIVVALVAAIVLAYRNSETFRNIVQAAWQGIQVAASFAWNSILKPALDGFLAALGWVGDKAMWLWQNVMIPAWDAIKNAISAVWNFIRPILDNIGKGIHAVGEIAAKVGDAMRNAFNGVVDVLKTPIHAVGKLLASIPDKVLGISIPGASTIKSWGETLQSLRVGGVVNNGMAGRTRNGVLWGPGSGTDDAILGVDAYGMPTALVSNKEGVVTADAMGHGGAGVVAALNRGWRPTPAQLQGLGLPAYATGGQVGEPYGLPTGSNISYGAPGFPDWVTKLGAEHNVKPSTYAGHQESDRNEAGYAPNPQHLNRGIDWSGSVEAMDAFARYLLGIAPDSPPLEQIIWQNPNTGAKVGWHGRTPDAGFSYFAADYGGHTDHVHTRQSAAFGGPVKPAIPDTNTQVPGYVPPTGLNPDGTNPNLQTTTPNTTTPSTTPQAETKRLKTFKELGSDLGGILFGGVEEFFGDSVPAWVWDANKLTEGADDGSNVRTSDNKGTTGNTTTPNTTTTGTTGDQTPPSTTGGFAPDTPDTLKAAEDSTKSKAPNPGNLKGADLYAFQIAKAALDLGMGKRGATIGEATALVESGDPLKMWANNADPVSLTFPHDAVGSDGSSSGLFQQQNNGAWGTTADRMDPYRSAAMFFKGLKGVQGWETMDPGAAAQAVQRSAFPDKYGKMIPRGEALVAKTGLFDTGGILRPGEFAFNGLKEPELIVKRHQWGVMDRNAAAVEQIARRDGGGNKLADVVNIQGYTAEEISSEWNRYQWARTAGYGTSRNR
ncbi:tape measure protein [Nocardia phage NS-I]|nr:tape measure protein [Nocardia phage NS-I]